MFASKNEIVLYYEHEIECEIILKMRFKRKFQEFITEIIGHNFIIYPIHKEEFQEFKEQYKKIKANNTFPEIYKMSVPEPEEDSEKTSELDLKKINDLFEEK